MGGKERKEDRHRGRKGRGKKGRKINTGELEVSFPGMNVSVHLQPCGVGVGT